MSDGIDILKDTLKVLNGGSIDPDLVRALTANGSLSIELMGEILIKIQELVDSGSSSSGIFVGVVTKGSSFPTTRLDGTPLHTEDFVRVDSNTPDADFPFTISGVTFNNKKDKAFYIGSSRWQIDPGVIQTTSETPTTNRNAESLNGAGTTQAQVNLQFAGIIGRNKTINVSDKSDIIDALNYIFIECKKAGYTFTITPTDSDSIRNITINVKDKDNNNLINTTLNDFILKTRKVAGYDLVDNITAQEIQDAIKDLAATLKNKSMSADDNNFSDFETDNFKNTALAKSTDSVRDYLNSVDTKLTTEKFIQKVLQNIATPQNNTDAVNKYYVDTLVDELSGKVMKFKGFISSTTPTGTIANGILWYEGETNPTTFPINVKTYDATNSEWSSTTIEYTPTTLDLWSNINDNNGYYWFGNNWNLIDENVLVDNVMIMKNNQGQLTFKVKTSADQYKTWIIQNDGTWSLETITRWVVVDTFTGITFDIRTLYILTQDTTLSGIDYKAGIYTYDSTIGLPVARTSLVEVDNITIGYNSNDELEVKDRAIVYNKLNHNLVDDNGLFYYAWTNDDEGIGTVYTKEISGSDIEVYSITVDIDEISSITLISSDGEFSSSGLIYNNITYSPNDELSKNYYSTINERDKNKKLATLLSLENLATNYYTKAESDNKFLDKTDFLNNMYPKGSIYTTYENINPSTFLGGTWVLIGGQDANLNYYPAFAIATDTAGTTISESIPNINGVSNVTLSNSSDRSGAFLKNGFAQNAIKYQSGSVGIDVCNLTFNASLSSPIYQDNAHVNVNAIKLFFWRRTDDAPIAFNTGNITMDTELDENATDDHIPTSKAVVDYVNEHGGSQIVETILWQSPNGIGGSAFTTNYDITLTEDLDNYSTIEVFYRDDNSGYPLLSNFFINKSDWQLLGTSMSIFFFGSTSYNSKSSYVVVYHKTTNTLTIRSANGELKFINIKGYKTIPMINTYSSEIRELIMNTPKDTTGTMTLTKGMSNYDYLDIYYCLTQYTNDKNFIRVRVSDFINIYNSSSSLLYWTAASRYIQMYRTNDTTLNIVGVDNIKIESIYGVKAEPVVVGDKPYKQLYFNQAGVSSGNITLNDDMSKFSYIEIFTRCAQFCQSMKVSVQQLLNNTSNTKPIANSAWDNGVTRYVYLTRINNTTFNASFDGGSTPTKVYEVIGWY